MCDAESCNAVQTSALQHMDVTRIVPGLVLQNCLKRSCGGLTNANKIDWHRNELAVLDEGLQLLKSCTELSLCMTCIS